MANRLFALLVGIDRYANPHQAPHLRGCVADVEGTYALLVDRFQVPAEQIRLLTAHRESAGDEAAGAADLPTRANILAGWQEHLGQAGAGDVVFFHYSGHGSQARSIDPGEPDGYDETIVPHDSRTPGVYDIADKELATLIHRVEEKGAQVLVLLDCCHAGSGTRAAAMRMITAAIRTCIADERMRPASAAVVDAPLPNPVRTLPTPSGWMPLGNHVLLAASRDDELSYEYRAPGSGQWHGAASYFFHRALAGADAGVTWDQLHDQVLTQVHAIYPAQTPQLEGPGHITLFGQVGPQVTPYLLVMQVEEQEYVRVNGGAALGITPGSRLAIYPPGADLPAGPDVDDALAIGLVEEVAVDYAWAKLDRLSPIEPGARVKVLALGWMNQPYAVRTDDAILRQALDAQGDSQSTSFLKAVGSEDETSAEFIVSIEQGCYVVMDSNGQPLWEERPPASPDGATRVAATLHHLAVYRNVLRLHNPAPRSGIHGRIAMEAVVYRRASRGGRPVNPSPLYDSGHGATITAGEKLQLTIHNHSDEPVYLALFNFDPEFGITRIYPAHAVNQKVEARGNVVIDQISPRLTGPQPHRAVEVLKVFATRAPTTFDVLQLPKLDEGDPQSGVRGDEASPLGQLFNAVRRHGLRDLVVELDDTAGGWTTAQLEVNVIAPPQRHNLPADLVRVAIDVDAGYTIEKPATWVATVYLGALDQATRGLDTSTLELPPGLDNPAAAAILRPVCFGEATEPVPGAPVLMGIAAPTDELAEITPDSPLRIEMGVADEPGLAGIVPVVFDGRHYYLAGHPVTTERSAAEPASGGSGVRRLACEVHFLPPSVDPGVGETTRDLKRAARLFFYKIILGELPDDTGLRHAWIVDGRVVYQEARRSRVADAERVALLIHGFTGESSWMVEKIWSWTQDQGSYDFCLTFDYESFGTGIRQNAEQLAAALMELGFGPANPVQLDVYGYGMGALLARALVELCDGEGYVDRVFMGGPPNAGTPLAKGAAMLPWLANIAINMAGAIPPAFLAHWLLEQLHAAADGLRDLSPDSELLAELNADWRPPALVPYYIQIGDNSSAYAKWQAIAQRLMGVVDSGLDILFTGDNDLIVGVDSARLLQGRWPRLEIQVLEGNHFQYFHSPEGRQVLTRWLS